MKNILYLHGFGSSKESYTGRTLRQLFPEYRWTLETFNLLDVVTTIGQLETIIREQQIDTVVSSSLGGIYNLFIKRDEVSKLIINKIFINPCCFPSQELSNYDHLPENMLNLCKKVEYEVYECHRDNTAENVFGIFSKDDELLHYHDFFAGKYGKYDISGNKLFENVIWVEDKHAHLDRQVLLESISAARDYFAKVAEARLRR